MQNSDERRRLAVGGISFVIAMLIMLSRADAFCNDIHSTRYPIVNVNNDTSPFLVNDTYGVNLGDGVQYIWCNTTSDYFCYSNSGAYDCYYGDTKKPMFIDEGNGTDYGLTELSLMNWINMKCYGTDCPDLSRYNNSGTMTSGTTDEVTGKVGKGQFFDAADTEYITLPYSAPTSTFSVTAWIMPSGTAPEGAILSWGNGAGHAMQLLKSGASDIIKYGEYNGAYESVSSGAIQTDGSTWTHVAMTKNAANNVIIYINGVLNASGSVNKPVGSLANLGIGAVLDGSPGTFFNGTIDNVRIWNRTLSANEITAMFNNTKPDDYSTLGSLDTGTIVTISTPTNTTYTTEPISFTWTNTSDYDTVWYSLNDAANITITGNTNITPVVGSNSIFLYANDSVPTLYSDSVYFTFTPTLDINITTPANGTYQAPPNVAVQWNYTSARPCSVSWYSVDGGTNTSSSCGNFSITTTSFSTGLHNVTLFINNTNGNADSETVWFNNQKALVNCSDAGAIEAVKFYFYTEDTLVALNGSAEYAIYDAVSDFTYNMSVVNKTNFSVCILDAPRVVDMMMLYRSSGYEQRTYYFYQATLTSTLQSINLYNIGTTAGEKLLVNTRDSNDNDQSDVYVDIDRYYPETDSYNTVAILKTDSIGEAITYLDLDDVFYKFTLSQSGVAVNTYNAMTITNTDEDPESIVLYIGAITTQFFDMIENVGIDCYFNDTTNNTVCAITDPTGLVVTATLYVEKQGLASITNVCTDTDTGTSFTLSCNLGNVSGEYVYYVQITPSPNPPYTIFRGSIYAPDANPYGDHGLVIALFLVIATASLVAVVSPIVGVTVGIVLGLLTLAGIVNISGTAIASIIAVGCLILFSKRGG